MDRTRDRMNRFSTTVLAALVLILLDAILWLAFGIAAACGSIASIAHPAIVRWVTAGLAWASAATLAGLAILLGRRSRLAFHLAVILLAIIAILSLADEVGLLGLVSLAVSVVPLMLLLKDRGWYVRQIGAGKVRTRE